MTFKELLKARDDAHEASAGADADLAEAEEMAHAAAVAAAERRDAATAADAAIVDRLRERGVHVLTAKDGTITTYHLTPPDREGDEPGPGWCAQHPIPGEGVE